MPPGNRAFRPATEDAPTRSFDRPTVQSGCKNRPALRAWPPFAAPACPLSIAPPTPHPSPRPSHTPRRTVRPTIHHAGPATARFCQGSHGPIAWRRGEGGILHGRLSPQNMVGERFLGKVPRLFFHLPHCCNRRAQGGPLHRAHRNARPVADEPRSANRRCLPTNVSLVSAISSCRFVTI